MLGIIIYCGVITILSVGSLKKPAFSLGAILCMFGLEQWGESKISFIANHSSFSNYISFVIVAMAIVLQLYRGRRLRLASFPVHLCIIALFFYSGISLLWTPIPDLAITEWRNQLPYILLIVFVLPQLIEDASDARDGLIGTLIAGSILATCLTFLVEWGYRSIVSDVSALGVVKLPLAIAQLGAYVFILAIMFRGRGLAHGCLTLGLAAISIALVLKTGSRGQMIAMIASAMVFAPMAYGRALSRSYIAALVVVAAMTATIWWSFPGISEVFSTGDSDRFSADRAVTDYEGRLTIAEALFNHYLNSGLLGMIFGLGSSASFSRDIVGFYVHIVPVEILCELGIVGAGLLLAILLMTARGVVHHMSTLARAPGSATVNRVVATLSALFVCELLLSLKEGSLLRDINLFLFPILIENVLRRVKARERGSMPVVGGAVQQAAVQN